MECIKLGKAKRKTRKNKKYFFVIILGFMLIIISLILLISRYCYHEEKKANDKKQVDDYLNYTTVDKVEPNEVISEDDNNDKVAANYVAALEIPAIELRRGLLNRDDPNNNVNKNIYMLKDTVLPDESDVSHIILASHSGNSYISYFKNLYKVDINDEVYFYYKNTKYVYSIYKIYEVDKTGNVELKITNNSDITLITCKGNLNKQIVVIGTLKSKEAC